MSKTYKVSEMFGVTIQGEGANAGKPCLFLRLSGCNFWKNASEQSSICPFCDTPQLHLSKEMTLEVIENTLIALASKSIGASNLGLVITGGEPLMQLDMSMLLTLYVHFKWIDIETNGSYDALKCGIKIKDLLDRCSPYYLHNLSVSCSPKTTKFTPDASWYKILIPDKKELLPLARKTGKPIYLQPVEVIGNREATRLNVEATVRETLNAEYKEQRVCLQLHKILHLP